MFGLPLELITMLFSTILGGVMSIIGQNQKEQTRATEDDATDSKLQG